MKQGFTLAETLITIGIIGIVAAMTLPVVIAKYQEIEFATAFKKIYSELQNSIDYITLSNGTNDCYTYMPEGVGSYQRKTQDCEQLFSNIVEKLQLTKGRDSLRNLYTDSDTVYANGGEAINRTCSHDYALRNSDVYITKNGMTLFLNSLTYTSIIIDVNGEKGPNKWGYDTFFMMLTNHNEKTNRILLTDEMCSIVEKGGKLPRTILRNAKENGNFSRYWE